MDNIALVLQSFTQNLRWLSNLQAFSAFNFNNSGSGPPDNSITVGIVVPSGTGRKIVGTQSSPFFISIVPTVTGNTLLGSDFRTVPAGGIVNQPNPFTIFSYNYTNMSANSSLLFNVGVQISPTFGEATQVDIELYVNSIKEFSSRVYTGPNDIGSTSFSISIPNTVVQQSSIQLLARSTPASNINLNVPMGYISIMES
jgi:hypothetical protein